MKLHTTSILFLLLLTLQLMGQKDYTTFYLTTEDGLSYRWVMSMHQDSKGYMWIGTYNGLNRYDGYEFEVFKHNENDSTTITGSAVNAITEDKWGQIWVSFNDNGDYVSIYDPQKHQFRSIQRGEEFIHFAPNATKTIDNEWLAYLPELAHFYYPTKQQDSLFPSFVKQLKNRDKVAFLTQKEDKDLWLWMADGTYIHYDIPRNKWTNYNLKLDKNINVSHPKLPIDDAGRFWYPSLEASTKNKFTYFKLPDTKLTDWNLYYLDNQQNIWISHQNKDLYAYMVAEDTLQYFGKNPNIEYAPFIDKIGTKWIGREMNIMKIESRKQLFEQYLSQNFELGGIQPVGISARKMMELENGAIALLNQLKHSFFLLNPKNQSSQELFVNIKNPYISDIELAKNNNAVWLMLGQKGLLHYSISNQQSDFFPLKRSERFLQKDHQERIWLVTKNRSTLNYQIGFFDLKTKGTTIFEPLYQGYFGFSYFQKEKNTLWVAYNKSLMKINTQTHDLEIVSIDAFKENNLFRDSPSVWCIIEWQSYLWLGTGEGLIQFDPDTHQVINQFTIKDGLPDNRVYTLQAAGDNLWLGTQFGLCRFNPSNRNSKVYYVEDGLSHNEFNRFSSLKAKDGKLYFGGLNGVNAFYPKDLEQYNEATADLVWTKLRYNS